MSIIESLKSIIGYSGSDYDIIFAICSIIVVLYFISTMFTILCSFFKR